MSEVHVNVNKWADLNSDATSQRNPHTLTNSHTLAIYKQFPRRRFGPHRKGVKVQMRYSGIKKKSSCLLTGSSQQDVKNLVPTECVLKQLYRKISLFLSSLLNWLIH